MDNDPLRTHQPSCARRRARRTSPIMASEGPSLIHVASFRDTFMELMEEEVDEELLNRKCDISIDDVFIKATVRAKDKTKNTSQQDLSELPTDFLEGGPMTLFDHELSASLALPNGIPRPTLTVKPANNYDRFRNTLNGSASSSKTTTSSSGNSPSGIDNSNNNNNNNNNNSNNTNNNTSNDQNGELDDTATVLTSLYSGMINSRRRGKGKNAATNDDDTSPSSTTTNTPENSTAAKRRKGTNSTTTTTTSTTTTTTTTTTSTNSNNTDTDTTNTTNTTNTNTTTGMELILVDPSPGEKNGFIPVDSNEVVISIAFFHQQRPLKTQEYLILFRKENARYLVLGSQPLTALRDRLYCLSDYIHPNTNARKPSGYFFFETTFYNDMRSEFAEDYSQIVIDWAAGNPRFLQPEAGPLKKDLMETTTFSDLCVRIGVPYLYVHQGDCQHLITVTDMRLINKSDNQNQNAYPLQTFQTKIRRHKCRVCDIYPAKCITIGDKMSPENPCFYCDLCYHALHYTEANELLYDDYLVFPYFHE